MRKPMGGMPGIVPGQIAFGHNSLFAGAPSITGGIFSMDSSSLGNLKPASLKAFAEVIQLGKVKMAGTATGAVHAGKRRYGIAGACHRKRKCQCQNDK